MARELHAYMGGILNNVGAVPKAIGGTADHVHILMDLPATVALADIVRDLKANSSRWVHDEMHKSKFAWQEGYGGFTVSPSQRSKIKTYIARQEEHHRKLTFQDEYVSLLEKCGVEFDPSYLW